LSERVLRFLGEAFAGFGDTEATARRRGLRWEERSTPFLALEDGEVVAHVGLLSMTLVIDGVERSVGGIHAVATHPARRGRGHALRLLREAVAFGRGRHELLILTTRAPGLYRKAGFEVVPEHRFVYAPPPPRGEARGRWLDLEAPADLALLHGLLGARQPLSDRFGVGRGRDVFLFAAARAWLWWLPELGCAVWASRREGALVIHDLVAERVPTLERIMACAEGPFDRVVTEFRPDRLGPGFVAEPHVLDGDDHLMALGALAPALAGAGPIALPRSARC
jgi:predicted N-acetyltransferase YhbS